jgi:sulfite reductase beta subunit-like hemoprotein
MTNAQILKRQKAVAAAVGSVRAEGLNPSMKTLKGLKQYAEGKITISQLRKLTLADIKSKSK